MNSDSDMPRELSEAVIGALQQAAQGQAPAAAETVRPFADQPEPHPVATALLAWFLGLNGQAAQGLPYALRAISQGAAVGPLAANYMSWTSNDVSLRNHTIEFAQAAVDSGWSIDPIGQAQQLAQQGAPELAVSMLTELRWPEPRYAEGRWESLLTNIAQAQQRLDGELHVVTERRVVVLGKMEADAAAIDSERERVQALVDQTTALSQAVAADHLAGEYEARAKAASDRAGRWTIATLAVSVGAILLASAFVLVGLARDHDLSSVLSKAAISLPLLALAAYLNRLGSEERRDARNWTHIELQIRTARPYLGNLSDELRDDVQAALALRFFPGQAQDPHGGTVANDSDDAMRLVRDLRAQSQASAPGAIPPT